MESKPKFGAGIAAMWPRSPWLLKATVVGMFVVTLGKLAGTDSTSTTTPSAPARPVAVQPGKSVIEACVDRGISYFQSISSYPTLSDGRNAVDVARERCSRTQTAF
jgi:hypothetical protein